MKIKDQTPKRLTANEKKMFRDYVEAREAKSPGALKAWARWYKVKLKSKDRVTFETTCRGSRTPAPPQTVVYLEEGCGQHCPKRTSGSYPIKGKSWVAEYKCKLTGCHYDFHKHHWDCKYTCDTTVHHT
jgi:hypothetical protein